MRACQINFLMLELAPALEFARTYMGNSHLGEKSSLVFKTEMLPRRLPLTRHIALQKADALLYAQEARKNKAGKSKRV